MNKKGFTLIELLIVVVIIGILAAIAIPRFGETRERAYVSTMSSDLRNLQTLQEQYHFDNSFSYTNSLADLNFAESDGVTITVAGADATSYTATANHDGTTRSCVLTVGAADPADDGIDCP